MSTRKYVGARYVPKIHGDWVKGLQYEGLVIVYHNGNSFISRKPVPSNVDIYNTEFWVSLGVLNPQLEEYHADVIKLLNDNQFRVVDKTDSVNINGDTFNRVLINNRMCVVTLEANYNSVLEETFNNNTGLIMWTIMKLEGNVFNLPIADLSADPFYASKYLGAFYATFSSKVDNSRTYFSQQLWACWDGEKTIIFSFDPATIFDTHNLTQTVCTVTTIM